jgi:hypothetical protein
MRVIIHTDLGGFSSSNSIQFERRVVHFSSSEMAFKKGRISTIALSVRPVDVISVPAIALAIIPLVPPAEEEGSANIAIPDVALDVPLVGELDIMASLVVIGGFARGDKVGDWELTVAGMGAGGIVSFAFKLVAPEVDPGLKLTLGISLNE